MAGRFSWAILKRTFELTGSPASSRTIGALPSRVTLNLGLRYEYYGASDGTQQLPGQLQSQCQPGYHSGDSAGRPGRTLPHLYNPKTMMTFSPRLGVAWDVRGNGKTVVRAGASLLTDFPELMNLVQLNPFGANFVSPSTGLVVNNSGTDANAHTPATLTPSAAQMTWNTTGPIFPISDSVLINGVTYTGLTCAAPGVE